MTNSKKLGLMANKLRIDSIRSTTAAGSGHPTTCMSCAEIMSTLFFSEMGKNDEFILSKGHAAPILWSAYAEAGFVKKSELLNLRKIDSMLEGHPTPHMKFIKAATGSLGQGLPVGVGIAIAQRLRKNKGRVYVLMGDGESAEGSIWEAANIAAHYKLNNLCAIVDVNRLGQSQPTMHGHNVEIYKKKYQAFGWNAIVVDGHKVDSLLNAFKRARKSSKPTAIIAKTFKGKGVSFLENKEGWHGKALDEEQEKKAIAEIGENNVKLSSHIKYKETTHKFVNSRINNYKKGEEVATRNAFGNALVNLGKKNKDVIAIDGDVKNSTMTEDFFKAFPKRGIESFIAEQNMAGMAIGFSSLNYIPFVATFAAFFTRAHDFIRMAFYSKSDIKFVGSHVGVSIGEDGPSQMGLEDISMFLSIPGSVILYPSDAVSTEHLVREMTRHEGISYLRTTRGKTPVIYNNNEVFKIGSLKVLRKSDKDKVLVIGAGITLHEALKAHDILQKDNINIRVIDLYSVQPVDKNALIKNTKECKGRVIVVEDHYLGGIGAVVSSVVGKIKHLYVKSAPRSGKPEELIKKYNIDSSAIVKTVKSF
jgi:transketolase